MGMWTFRGHSDSRPKSIRSRNDQCGCEPPPPEGCDEEGDEEPEELPELVLPPQTDPPEEPELGREDPPPEVCAGGGVKAGRGGREARGTAGVDGVFAGQIILAVGGKSFAPMAVGVLTSFEVIAPLGGLFAFTKRCSCGS